MIHISRKHSENIRILTVDGMFSQHRQGFGGVCVCVCVCVLVTQSTPWIAAHQATLSMGILQARILESVAIPFSRGSFQPRDCRGPAPADPGYSKRGRRRWPI